MIEPIPHRLPAPLEPSPSAPIVRVVGETIQQAGLPQSLRRVEYGGPTLGLDVRLFLDRHLLSELLRCAEGTSTARVMIDGPAMLIESRVGGDGRPFEVWTLLSGRPARPEPGPFSESAPEPPFPDDATDPIGRPPNLGEGPDVRARRLYGRPGDLSVRMYLDAHLLRTCLARAREALSGRVQLDHVGLVVEDYDDGGERFQVWTITCGGMPRPEPDRIVAR